jgi:FdhD protein
MNDETDRTEDDEDVIALAREWPAASLASAPVYVDRSGRPARRERALAAECPVSITYNGLAHAVMMATPSDIEDFLVGFSLTEEIVASAAEIESMDVRALELGLLGQVWIPADRQKTMMEHRRNLVGQTSCGICGLVELEQAVRRYGPVAAVPQVDTAAVFAAFDALPERQVLNRETGAAHAAAFADRQGRILAVREDVGRHTALDKLIGHLARDGIDPASGFVAMTSRISFELVQKCLSRGIPMLAGISVPTALAVDLASSHRLTLVALARSDGFQVFSDPHGLFPTAA